MWFLKFLSKKELNAKFSDLIKPHKSISAVFFRFLTKFIVNINGKANLIQVVENFGVEFLLEHLST